MIQPRNDFVLIERIDKPHAGRISIPDSAKEKGITGIVRAVGPGKWIEGVNGGYVRRTMEVKTGDMVLFNSKWNQVGEDYQTVGYRFDDKMHLVMEADIFCKIDA